MPAGLGSETDQKLFAGCKSAKKYTRIGRCRFEFQFLERALISRPIRTSILSMRWLKNRENY